VNKIGLECVQEYYLNLINEVIFRASPFLTRQTILETVNRAIPASLSDEAKMSIDARVRVLATTRATYYRTQGKSEPDQYSILQKLVDCLCPVYPGWISAIDILHRVAVTCPDISLLELEEVLHYYVRKECFEQDGDRYRLAGFLIWVNEAISLRHERLIQYSGAVTEGMEGFLQDKPHHQFSAIRLFGTTEEFEDFLRGIKAYVDEWFTKNQRPPRPEDGAFLIALVTAPMSTKEEKSDT